MDSNFATPGKKSIFAVERDIPNEKLDELFKVRGNNMSILAVYEVSINWAKDRTKGYNLPTLNCGVHYDKNSWTFKLGTISSVG